MRFAEDSGLWTTGPGPDAVQLSAVLEVSGAVLSWSVDGPESDVHRCLCCQPSSFHITYHCLPLILNRIG